jgi:NitT/TauT family transport system substrate-binding protein
MLNRLEFALALGAAVAASPLPAGAQTAPVKLRVGTNAADNVTDLLWAKVSGMFTKAGLDVDVQKLTSGSAVTAAVLGGTLDIGRTSLLPLISARNRGIPVQLIAPAELGIAGDPSGGIITLKDSPVRTGRDLNGQTLPSPSLRDFFEITLRAWIDQNGGDSRTVKFVELPVAADLAALEAGRIAAAAMANPFLATALASGKVRLLGRPNDVIGKRFLITGWFATEAFIAANRDAVAKFAATLQQAAAYTDTHQSEAVSVTAPFWGLDPSIILAMAKRPAATSLDPKEIQPLMDLALHYGVIDKPMKAEAMISSIGVRPKP